MAGTIQYAAFFFNFSPFHDRLNRPTIHPILSEFIYTRFFMLKKPDFRPVSGFSGQTIRSGPDFKTLEGMLNSGATHNFVADRMVQ